VKLIVGLGNPDAKYADTRHNIGFAIVECLAERNGIVLDQRKFQGRFGRGRIGRVDVGILEPLTYMNRSGSSVVEAVKLLPLEEGPQNLIVVMDDVDLPYGRLRLRAEGGAGGQKGLADIIARLGRKDFIRLRFGLGRPPSQMETASYVLQRFSPAERFSLATLVLNAARAIEQVLEQGVVAAMAEVNRKESRGIEEKG